MDYNTHLRLNFMLKPALFDCICVSYTAKCIRHTQGSNLTL